MRHPIVRYGLALAAVCGAGLLRGLLGSQFPGVVRLDDGIARSLRDVTERKEREAARQESEDRFRLLADAVDDVFGIIDVRQQRVVYVSPAYERVWGFSAERLYRDPKAWREHVHPAGPCAGRSGFRSDARRAPRDLRADLSHSRPERGPRWVRDKAWLVRSGDGERIAGIMTDISAEKASEEKQRLLNLELDHRLKNTFSLVQSIVPLSARGARNLGAFVESVEARIRALARGQDLLVRGSWHSADLDEIGREILGLHTRQENRIQIEVRRCRSRRARCRCSTWPSMSWRPTPPSTAPCRCPAGRSACPGGSTPTRGGPALWLTWHESGGPLVRPPPARGFGSMLIEQALASDFGGEIEIAFLPEGITCTMRLPLSERLTSSRNAA